MRADYVLKEIPAGWVLEITKGARSVLLGPLAPSGALRAQAEVAAAKALKLLSDDITTLIQKALQRGLLSG